MDFIHKMISIAHWRHTVITLLHTLSKAISYAWKWQYSLSIYDSYLCMYTKRTNVLEMLIVF